jgi:hypothetical protein
MLMRVDDANWKTELLAHDADRPDEIGIVGGKYSGLGLLLVRVAYGVAKEQLAQSCWSWTRRRCRRAGAGLPGVRSLCRSRRQPRSAASDCDRAVIREARNLEDHRGLRTHIRESVWRVTSLTACALRRFDVAHSGSPVLLSKRAPSASLSSLRVFRINGLRASGSARNPGL